MNKKALFKASIEDLVSSVFYYDRKNDEELTIDDVKELISTQQVTIDEIVNWFRAEIEANYPELKKGQ